MSERPRMRSTVAGMVWPAVPGPGDALLFALYHQLEQSQWWSPSELRALQAEQLAVLLEHARNSVPFYEQRLRGVNTLGDLSRAPLLTRQEVQRAGSALGSTALPQGHGPVTDVRTSGSLGRSVQVQSSRMGKLFHGALSLRYHLWHGRDPGAKLAALRRTYHKPGSPTESQPWVPGFSSGPMVSLDVGEVFETQLDWLVAQEAPYLLTYPSNLGGLLRLSARRAQKPEALRQVMTYGEALDPELRTLCSRVWGVPLVEAYSAQELGAIALQCPEQPHYHVMSEDVLVEVLDADGKPSEPGQLGRVVVTDLHNFATPLIRYELGDWAVPGAPCECGRGLPVLQSVVGRTRNLLTLPDGRQLCPRFLTEEWAFDLGVRQLQVHQLDLSGVVVHLVTEGPLQSAQEERLLASIRSTLKHPFELRLDYVDELPPQANGKFEEFKSDVSPG